MQLLQLWISIKLLIYRSRKLYRLLILPYRMITETGFLFK